MRRLSGLALLLVLAAGCAPRGSDGDAARAAATDVPGAVAPVAAAADMCAEHGVLEVVCTRCHPNLVPIFKGKGDWCAEHEFPESFCPTCHPERGGRPAVDVAVEEAPAQGTLIRFETPEIARQVRLPTVPPVQVADPPGLPGPAGAGTSPCAGRPRRETMVAGARGRSRPPPWPGRWTSRPAGPRKRPTLGRWLTERGKASRPRPQPKEKRASKPGGRPPIGRCRASA